MKMKKIGRGGGGGLRAFYQPIVGVNVGVIGLLEFKEILQIYAVPVLSFRVLLFIP